VADSERVVESQQLRLDEQAGLLDALQAKGAVQAKQRPAAGAVSATARPAEPIGAYS